MINASLMKNFVYCKKAGYIEYRLQIRIENDDLNIGKYEHDHYWQETTKRKNVTIESKKLGIIGKCDYIISDEGIKIPIEIKKRKCNEEKPPDHDIMQLMAYVILIEERYECVIDHAFIIYLGSRRKYKIDIDESARKKFFFHFKELQESINNEDIPETIKSCKCVGCQYEYFCFS